MNHIPQNHDKHLAEYKDSHAHTNDYQRKKACLHTIAAIYL